MLETEYGKGYKNGLESGRWRTLKELAKTDDQAALLKRLQDAEDIVDWITTHFDAEKARGKRIALNDHIEIHCREQQASRPEKEEVTDVEILDSKSAG